MKRLKDLNQDPKNANKGTTEGARLLEASLKECGFARPVLVDSEGTLIAGNKTARAGEAVEIAEVVDVEGGELVVVQRTDLDANEPKAKKLAILDNRTAQLGLSWDGDRLREVAEGRSLDGLGFTSDELAVLGMASSAGLELTGSTPRPSNTIRVGMYSFEVDREEIDRLQAEIMNEANEKGVAWEQIVSARLRL